MKAWTRIIAVAVGDGLKDIYHEKEGLTVRLRIKAEAGDIAEIVLV